VLGSDAVGGVAAPIGPSRRTLREEGRERRYRRSPWRRAIDRPDRREASGRVFAAVTHLDVGQLRVVCAIGLSRFRSLVTEPETPRAGLTEGPAAGNDAAIRTRRRWCHADRWRHRDWPGRQERHVRHRRPTASYRPGTGQRWQRWSGHSTRRGSPWRSSARAIAANWRWPRWQIQPMRLADHRIFRNTQPPAYLGGRQPLIPKRP
jgi:hypothetical protein